LLTLSFFSFVILQSQPIPKPSIKVARNEGLTNNITGESAETVKAKKQTSSKVMEPSQTVFTAWYLFLIYHIIFFGDIYWA
jgi:hypothetical protein